VIHGHQQARSLVPSGTLASAASLTVVEAQIRATRRDAAASPGWFRSRGAEPSGGDHSLALGDLKRACNPWPRRRDLLSTEHAIGPDADDGAGREE